MSTFRDQSNFLSHQASVWRNKVGRRQGNLCTKKKTQTKTKMTDKTKSIARMLILVTQKVFCHLLCHWRSIYFMLSINFPCLICQKFRNTKKVPVPGEDAAKLDTNRKAEEMAWSCVNWNLKLLFKWSSVKCKQHCQWFYPLQVLELTVS